MHSPKVSVIIPCYNAEEYLRQCLESVVNQTLREIEIICIDDGSSDGTLRILREFRTKDSRVRVVSQENAGAGTARNNGLRQATGEYLSFLDADDFFELNMLKEAVAAADQYQADYVVFNSDRYHMDTQSFAEVPWVVRKQDLPPYMPFSYRQLTDNVFLSFVGWAWDKLFRRSFVLDHDLWFQEQRTTNDALFVFSALVTAKRIAVVDKVLAHQRRGGSESLSVTREKSWHCFYDALTALKERLVRENIFWELEQDFINYALHFSLWHLNSLAEPTHTILENKLREEWFGALGISDKPESYFYNREEYAQYVSLMKEPRKCAAELRRINNHEYEPLPEFCKTAAPDGVYSVNLEYDMIRDRLMEDRTCWERYQYSYWREKLQSYQRAQARCSPSESEIFLQRMRREFRRAEQLGQLDKGCFTQEQWMTVRDLIIHSNGAVSILQSVGILRKLSPYVPKPLKRMLVTLLKSK